jgi:NADH-quinone oxidoreductase subunit N
MISPIFALAPVLPEIVLALGILVLILLGAWKGEGISGLVSKLAVLVLGLATILVVTDNNVASVDFSGSFISDAFGRYMKVLSLIGALVALVLSMDFIKKENFASFEYPVLVLLSTLGMMLMVSANDLIALYLGLELSSLALYVIAAIQRDNLKSTEAGLKYFVLGALSSGMLLYGASLLYGFAGTVSFAGIATAIHGHASIGVIFGMVFLIAGLAFKISAVPFHMWTPDVYEGAPTPVTAFFASAPKMAAMAMSLRIISVAFPGILVQWQQIFGFLSILSMLLGAFAAIGQNNIKRLMAYSSIGHMGFALLGLVAGSHNGVQGVVIYMTIYLVMTLGTFAAIIQMRRDGKAVETIADLAGLSKTNGKMAFFLAMMMFSLAGIPPLAGFFAKFYVFAAVIESHLYFLAVVGVLSSVVGAFYYLRIVKIMYFDEAKVGFDPPHWTVDWVLVLAGIFVLAFWIYPAPIVNAAAAAAASLF